MEAAKSFFKRIRSDAEFDRFYDDTVASAQEHKINQPELPRYRKRPARYESGSEQHCYSSPRAYHRHLYFEACDLLHAELGNRFDHQLNSSVLALEQTLIKAANGEDCQNTIKELEKSCYKDDIVIPDLARHLLLLRDVVQKSVPGVKKVTSVHTICDAMNSNDIFKEMLPTVHQLLRLYLTLPTTSVTSERTFSALRQLLTYLHSKMTEKRLNNCLLLHIHKDLTDSLDLILAAKEFISLIDECQKHSGHFE